MKVLAIGNSFSDDALTFTHNLAECAGIDIYTGNLYIGGCTLETHWQHALDGDTAYGYYINAMHLGSSSLRDALVSEQWDVVTLQQASGYSGLWDSYQPYLTDLSAFVRQHAPTAKQYIHQTWAYETDSGHPHFPFYHNDQAEMYAALTRAYENAAGAIHADGFIPCGDAFQIARRMPLFDYAHGGQSLNRDGFHASLTCGRYLLACVWVEALTGHSMVGNSFMPRAEGQPEPTAAQLTALQQAAHEAVTLRQK